MHKDLLLRQGDNMMSIPRLLTLLCLLPSSAVLSGCLQNPATSVAPAASAPATASAPSTTPSAPVAAAPVTTQPAASPVLAARALPAKSVNKPVAKVTTRTKPTIQKASAPVQIKRVKQDATSAAYQVGQKLTPQEVEDIIRKLSVCKPT